MPASAGVGFKPQHAPEALASQAEGLWFEVHAENYMVDGGPRLALLEQLRQKRPLSIHGVGLSLGGKGRPDPDHLARLRGLVDRFDPFIVSEHLAWSVHAGSYFPDLLPFPRTRDLLHAIAHNIDIVQNALGRQIAIENPSLYLDLDDHELSEIDFLRELVRKTGCRLLLDVNNVFVGAANLGFDPLDYLDGVPAGAVQEIHLAGHSADPSLGEHLLIDSHDAPVAEAVWQLFERLVARIGPRPTLIERDGNLPPFAELMAERGRAQAILNAAEEPANARAA